MFDDYNMLLDLLILLLGLFLFGSPLLKFFPSPRYILAILFTTAIYIINVSFLLVFGLALFGLYMVVYHLLDTINGHRPYKHFILRRLEKGIQAQLLALRQQEHQTSESIREFSEALKEWNGANTELMHQIRVAEKTIQKKVRDWEPTPARAYFHPTGGCTIWHRPQEPSRFALVRWWKGEADPRVFAVSCDLAWAQARLETKTAALGRLQREHGNLTDALKRVTARKNAVRNQPNVGSWDDPSRLRVAPQQKQQQQQPRPQYLSVEMFRSASYQITRRIEAAYEGKGNMLHVCVACAGGNHPWIHQYDTIAAAAASSLACPCPTAQARMAASPWLAPFAPSAPYTARVPAPAIAPVTTQAPLPQFSAALPVLEPPRSLFGIPPTPVVAASVAAIPASAPAPAPAPVPAPVPASVPMPPSLASILTPASSAVPAASVAAVPAVPSLASILTPSPVVAAAPKPTPAPATTATAIASAPAPAPGPAAPVHRSAPPTLLNVVWPSSSSNVNAPAQPTPPAAAGLSLMERTTYVSDAAAPAPIPAPVPAPVPAPAAPVRRSAPPTLLNIVWPSSSSNANAPAQPTPPAAAGLSLMERTTYVSDAATTNSAENAGLATLATTSSSAPGQEQLQTEAAGPAKKKAKSWKGKEKETYDRATREEEETREEGESSSSASRYRQRF